MSEANHRGRRLATLCRDVKATLRRGMASVSETPPTVEEVDALSEEFLRQRCNGQKPRSMLPVTDIGLNPSPDTDPNKADLHRYRAPGRPDLHSTEPHPRQCGAQCRTITPGEPGRAQRQHPRPTGILLARFASVGSALSGRFLHHISAVPTRHKEHHSAIWAETFGFPKTAGGVQVATIELCTESAHVVGGLDQCGSDAW